jgi:hypothetical protein
MTNEEIRRYQRAEPFQPFDLHLADGRVLHVPHPEFVYVPPINTRTVIVTDSRGITETINVLLIVPVRSGENGKRRRKAG